MNINGSADRVLWESFDYPTDTLIPGMKLGVNYRTGRNWSLTSCGDLKDYTNQSLRLNVKEFVNIPKPDFENFNYNFTNVSNGVEDYFTYSFITDSSFDIWDTISGWQLKYNGDLFNNHGAMIAEVSLCYGYSIKGSSVFKGCELWEQPSCRNHNETFVLKSGHFAKGNGSKPIEESANDANASLTESDCRENCWKDCECVGFVSSSKYGSGCTYWKGKIFTFVQSYDGSQPKQFVLVLEASGSSTKRKRKKEELRELMTLEEHTETHPVASDRGQGHHLR
ncbi:Hypothetical predicted protein [Olea europaea subsp. europaea]|uniref:Apple domain-containing protein n=1 Tax=Olea europaea subsp. europaea TaxID=158383 RepID=A0A8S0TLM0_OLEEU|nr:Hypothetical predicted protein [Olea europaea subsp. europaea]